MKDKVEEALLTDLPRPRRYELCSPVLIRHRRAGLDYALLQAVVSPAGADDSVERGSGSRDMPGLAPFVR
ncbi:MAG TPA: hypothetical protein VNE39_15060 [Planctomycetota bacterium]|nr:hypothetical protein [Planctomycetota bacterium]